MNTINEYIVYTDEGRTLDNNGVEKSNCQILDFIEAENLDDAQEIASYHYARGDYGAFGEKSLSFRRLA